MENLQVEYIIRYVKKYYKNFTILELQSKSYI